MAPPVGLLAAIRSGYVTLPHWIAWADDQIGKMTKPPMWLLNLSLAKNSDEAWKAIGDLIEDTPDLPLKDLDEAVLGLIALQYFEGRIGFRDFLLRAGDHTDPSSCSTDCEYFYDHLNRYEAAGASSEYEVRAAPEILAYLKEAIDVAEIAKAQINSIRKSSGPANQN